jgi:hypothetical protein
VRLIIHEPGLEHEVEIDLDRITIGRSEDNTVVISDTKASPNHCVLEKTAEGWRISDLGSKYGILLDGRPVRKFSLAEGSVISIGNTTIHFGAVLLHDPEQREYKPLEKPSRIRKTLPVLIAAAACLLVLWFTTHIIFTSLVHRQPKVHFRQEPGEWQSYWPTCRTGFVSWPRSIDREVIARHISPDESYEILRVIPRGTSFDLVAKKHIGLTNVVNARGLGRGRAGAEEWPRRRRAVDEEVRIAVKVALKWLANHQDKDGKWDQDGFQKNCDPDKDKRCGGQGTSQYDVGVTSLALLAFMGAGHNHRVGPFMKTVRKGLKWLRGQQQEDGSFGPRLAESWVYNTAIATAALCEAYRITQDYRLKKTCRKAVDFILAAQNPRLGWKYEPQSGENDTSVTGWMVLALKSAKRAGLKVEQSAFDGAVNWFDRMTNAAGKVGYMRPGDDGTVIRNVSEHYEKLPVMTGVATICRILCGQKRQDPKVLRGVDILMSHLPDWNKPRGDKVNMYYWFWGTHAMCQYGGQKWHKWSVAIKKALCQTPRVGGCAHGSWDPVGKWGMVGGRVYSTAINCLTLEACYLNRALNWRRR